MSSIQQYSIIKYFQIFLACLLLSCLPLPQFVGESGVALFPFIPSLQGSSALAALCLAFVASMFIPSSVQFFQSFRQSGYKLSTFLSKVKLFNITKIDLAVLILYLAAVVATFASYFFKESLSGLSKYTLYFFLYLAFRALIQNRQDIYLLFAAALIGSLWVSLEGLWQVLFGAQALATWEDPNIHISEQLNRVYSTLLNPNLLSAYLLLLWPLAVACLTFWNEKIFISINNFFVQLKRISSKFPPTRGLGGNNTSSKFALPKGLEGNPTQEKETKPLNKLSSGGLFCVCALCAVALLQIFITFQTGSRGAWLGLGAQLLVLLVIVYFVTRSTWLLIVSGVLCVGAVLIALSKVSVLNRLLSIFSSYDHSSNSFRLHVWKACWQIFIENIFFGIGPGSKAFYEAYGIYMDSKYSALGAYSLPIEVAVEMGLLGLGSLMFFVICLWQAAGQTLKSLISTTSSSTEVRSGDISSQPSSGEVQKTSLEDKLNGGVFISTAILLGLLGLLISALFDIVILRPQVQIIFWMLIAVLSFYHSQHISSSKNG